MTGLGRWLRAALTACLLAVGVTVGGFAAAGPAQAYSFAWGQAVNFTDNGPNGWQIAGRISTQFRSDGKVRDFGTYSCWKANVGRVDCYITTGSLQRLEAQYHNGGTYGNPVNVDDSRPSGYATTSTNLTWYGTWHNRACHYEYWTYAHMAANFGDGQGFTALYYHSSPPTFSPFSTCS